MESRLLDLFGRHDHLLGTQGNDGHVQADHVRPRGRLTVGAPSSFGIYAALTDQGGLLTPPTNPPPQTVQFSDPGDVTYARVVIASG